MKSWTMVFLFVFLSGTIHAQDLLKQAIVTYHYNHDLQKGIALIDSAVKEPAYARDAQAWYFRAFIYRKLFNRVSGAGGKALGNEAFRSIDTCMQICTNVDSLRIYRQKCYWVRQGLLSQYYNRATALVSGQEFNLSLEYFSRYRQEAAKGEGGGLNAELIRFYLPLGAAYTSAAMQKQGDERKRYLQSAIDAYKEILKLEETNFNSLYNLGLVCQKLAMQEVEAEYLDTLKEALRYMLLANEVSSSRYTLSGLITIYEAMGEEEKAAVYQSKLSEK